jgi:Dehydratase family
MTPTETNNLRSQRWLGNGPYSFAPRSRTLQNGLIDSDFTGKPVIAIVNTWAEMNTCHGHLRDVTQVVKRGVGSGGLPSRAACMSLGEIMMKPTAMLYRNLLSMETEVVALCGLLSRVPQGIREGKVRYRDNVVDGSETIPDAFRGLLRGENFGKVIVRVSD